MGWTLGTEGADRAGTGSVPAGVGHAVDVEAATTAYGRPFRSLQVWPDVPWQRVGMLGLTRCIGCIAEAG